MIWMKGRYAQVALLVGVEDGDERHLRQVEALAQEGDADEHVESAQPEVAQHLDPLQRVQVRVDVADADAVLLQVVGRVLREPLGQRRDQRALALVDALAQLHHEVVDLALRGPDLDLVSTRPVGLASMSTTRFDFSFSYRPGVADT